MDDAGRPQAGVRVNAGVVRGNGTIPLYAITDAEGYASFEWVLRPIVAENELLVYLAAATDGFAISYTVNAVSGPPASLALTVPDASAIPSGSTRNAAVDLRDAWSVVAAPTTTIAYSTSNAGVATVSNVGLVTTVGRGTANIIATHGTLADTVAVQVISPVPAIVSSSHLARSSYGIAFTSARVALLATPSVLGLAQFDAAALAPLGSVANSFVFIDVAVAPDSSKALASAYGAQALVEFELATGTITRTFALPTTPLRVRYAPDGTTAYVTLLNGVAKIDLATEVVTTLALTGDGFNGVALSGDGATLYVSEHQGRVYRIDAATFTSLGSVMIGGTPQSVALSADGGRLFVARTDAQLLALSSTTLAVVGSSPSVFGGFDVMLSADGAYLIVLSNVNAAVTVLDELTLFRYQSLALGAVRRGAIEPGTGAVWISTDNSVLIRLVF